MPELRRREHRSQRRTGPVVPTPTTHAGRRPPSLSLDLLRGFRAAARHLSFTRAAQELFITQSAISHEVKALEQQLGTPLFRRANRALQLTDAGRELLHAVDEALSLVDAAAARISGTTKAFTVTTTVPLASLWLGPRLARFTRQHPDRSMRVVASNDVLDIEREGIDVAIRYLRRGAASAGGEKLCQETKTRVPRRKHPPFSLRTFMCREGR